MEITTKRAFDESKVDLLRDTLKQCADSGEPRYFEIRLDGMPVVARTNDYLLFDGYAKHIDEDSAVLDVIIYPASKTTYKGKCHRFLLKPEIEKPKEDVKGLSGMDVERRIEEALSQREQRYVYERKIDELERDKKDLGKELERTKSDLGEANDYIRILEGRCEESRKQQSKLDGIEKIAGVTERIVDKLGGGPLSGIFSGDEKKQAEKTQEAEVTFEKSNPKHEISEDQKKYLSVLENLEEVFTDEELVVIMRVLNRVSQNKPDLITIAELLNIS